MGMLHPMYNHLGRAPKKKHKRTKEQQAADRRHEAFILKHGVKPGRRRRLRGISIPPHWTVAPET